MATLHGTIVDTATNERIDAKVRVLDASGNFRHPLGSLLKRGPGTPFFFSDGEFEVDAGRGRTDVLVERGTEYVPKRVVVEMPTAGVVDVEIAIERWHHPQRDHWYPGNTHIHYDEKETRPDDRLGVDCSVEGYNVTVVSVLDRRQLPYASNRYPIGVMNEFTTAHHVLDIGEENRHYGDKSPWGFGYGHVMFLNIRNLVQPVSRGHILTAQFDPDYPPLCFCCDEARDQGGLVIWCHNGRGMEAPVAAALGKLDAFNLFDPFWMDPEYDLWYRLLNCGINLPASTGTDWFVCSNNRVYVQTEEAFSYAGWIDGMKRGCTYITNGPAVNLTVNGEPIGAEIEVAAGVTLEAEISFDSHYLIDAAELVVNGQVQHREIFTEGQKSGSLRLPVAVERDGWVAARLWGNARDSFGQSIYAHTSPIRFRCGWAPGSRADDARFFVDSIDESLKWIDTVGRYNSDQQRDEVRELFWRGREIFAGLL
ncbi:MAG: CehA/McbA family metallohydrolase [Candidatus Latescibacterota bacterium]|nr:CehA/McbA family metallohydrolase [Candidatus Latescibacterota bacterium]